MPDRSPTKLERITHEQFASSLRSWCNEEPNETETLTDKFRTWINDISAKLEVGFKVDIMKIPHLTGLTQVELDFLKLSIPNLTYFARSFNSTPRHDTCTIALKKWAASHDASTDLLPDGARMLLPKLKFKNVLLRLLSNPSSHRRIARIHRYLSNPSDFDHSNISSRSTLSNPDVDDLPSSPPHETHELIQPIKDCVLTPKDPDHVGSPYTHKPPSLFIEYVEPSPGLFSTANINFSSPNLSNKYHTHNCFIKSTPNNWVESLRGGYVPSHIHFNP